MQVIHGLSVIRNDDNGYCVRTPAGQLAGGIVRWHMTDSVNSTGVRQFRHPWGDSDTLTEAVAQFLKIPWVRSAVVSTADMSKDRSRA